MPRGEPSESGEDGQTGAFSNSCEYDLLSGILRGVLNCNLEHLGQYMARLCYQVHRQCRLAVEHAELHDQQQLQSLQGSIEVHLHNY